MAALQVLYAEKRRRARLERPGRHLVYLHGDEWWIDPTEPICPVCGEKVKVCW